jgi:hypothetical protein
MPHMTLQGPHGGSTHKYIITIIIVHDGNRYEEKTRTPHIYSVATPSPSTYEGMLISP